MMTHCPPVVPATLALRANHNHPSKAGRASVWHLYKTTTTTMMSTVMSCRQSRSRPILRQRAVTSLDAIESFRRRPGVFSSISPSTGRSRCFERKPHARPIDSVETRYLHARTMERQRRSDFPSPRERAADAYLVRRGAGKTIIAGYPWLAIGGATPLLRYAVFVSPGRLEEARDVLVGWADVISQGMLPNRFPDHSEQPEFNSVDAWLW